MSTVKGCETSVWWKSRAIQLHLLVILALTASLYLPSIRHAFVNWDDPAYVLENEHIREVSWTNLRTMFSEPIATNYHPLTILSLAMNYSWSGTDPGSYHAVNVVLHLLNTVLVFLLIHTLSRGRLWTASLTALIFAIHPMHVESVAWVSERKDVLYTLFFLLALILYLKYLCSSGVRYYLLALAVAALSLLSKPTAVVLAPVLLLADVYMERKVCRRMIWDKVPFFTLSILFGLVTYHLQAAIGSAHSTLTLWQRVMVASYGFLAYIGKFFLPIHQSAFYPFPPSTDSLPVLFRIAPLIVVVILGAALYLMRRNRLLFFGVFFYTMTIALTLQFIPVGTALMADRYTYVPYIGLAFMVIGVLRSYWRKWILFPLAIWLLFCVYNCHQRVNVWQNDDTLWSDIIEAYPLRVPKAYANRGTYYKQTGRIDAAIRDFKTAIKLDPDEKDAWDAHNNLANTYFMLNEYKMAAPYYLRAIELYPDQAMPRTNYSGMLSILGRQEEALRQLNIALQCDPGYLPAYISRALVHQALAQYEEEANNYSAFLRRDPHNAKILNARAMAYMKLRRFSEAKADLDRAIGIEPAGTFYVNRALLNHAVGEKAAAVEDALNARRAGVDVPLEFIQKLQQ